MIFQLQYEVWSAWDCSAKHKCNFSVVSMLYILRFWISKFRLVCDSIFFSHMVMAVATRLFFCLLTSRACLSCNCACYGVLACNEGKILTSQQICPRFYSTKHASFPWWVWGLQQAQCDVEGLKIQLEEAKIEKRHKEECEAIRRLIAAQPPQQCLNDFEKEVVG